MRCLRVRNSSLARVKFHVENVTPRRNLSTSTNALTEGVQEVLDTLAKVRAREDVFQQYQRQNVFVSSGMNWLTDRLMFYHVNRPRKTQVDLIKFIHGASYAMKATRLAMHSNEFAGYVEREAEARGPLAPDCEAAEMVHRSLETVSYYGFKRFLFKSRSAGVCTEIKELEMHSAHLLRVNYHRVARGPTTNNSGQKVMGPMDEKLQLAVLFDVTEHVNVTLPDSEASSKVVARPNKSIWQFESKVTTPEDIDWVIEPLELDLEPDA